MTFRCLDCTQPIEGDPWWYDPLAHGINRRAQGTQITRIVSQRLIRQRLHQHPFTRRAWKGRWVGASIPDGHRAIESGAWGVLLSQVSWQPLVNAAVRLLFRGPRSTLLPNEARASAVEGLRENLFGRGLDFLEQPPPRRDDALVTVSLSHLLSESYVARWDSKQEILLFLAERDAAE